MKRLFLTASGLFILGTLLGAWSPDFLLLLLGRILQGAGTGIALPLMFNIIMDQAPLNRLGFMVGAAMLVCRPDGWARGFCPGYRLGYR